MLVEGLVGACGNMCTISMGLAAFASGFAAVSLGLQHPCMQVLTE